MNPMVDRRGCPCCSFDIFLPECREAPIGDHSPNIVASKELQEGDEDVPCSPQEVFALLHALANAGEDDRDSQRHPLATLVVDTHGHAQLNRERDEAYTIPDGENDGKSKPLQLISLACAVEPSDWQATLDYASSSTSILPGLGVHPWYLAGLSEKKQWLADLESLLLHHPNSMVAEIGLCKKAICLRQHPEGKTKALEVQRSVFTDQFILAAKLRRPVSVHCVDQHGVFISILNEILNDSRSSRSENDSSTYLDSFPVSIGMHSFTGTAHQVKQLLDFEKQISTRGQQQNKPLFYFGFSHAVNHAMCTSDKARRKGREAVCAVPQDRLLAESDVHSPVDVLGGTLGAIAYIAWARKASIEETAVATSRNGLGFLQSALVDRNISH